MAEEQTPETAPEAQLRPSADRGDSVAKDEVGTPVAAPPAQVGRAELQLGAAGRMRMDSDKCDWRVVTPAAQIRGPAIGVTDDISVSFPTGRMRMESDKCDWRIQVSDGAQRVARAATTGAELEVRGSNPAVTGEIRSSKCDWTVQVTGAWPGMRTPPQLRADLRADKCDFAVQLEVGAQGGPKWRLRGAGSDKCDFRVLETEEIRPGDSGQHSGPG